MEPSSGQNTGPDELIRRCTDGDERAFEEFARRYRPSMLSTARTVIDPSAAAEVVQLSLREARKQLREGEMPAHTGRWLQGITRQIAREQLRIRLLTPPPGFADTPAPAAPTVTPASGAPKARTPAPAKAQTVAPEATASAPANAPERPADTAETRVIPAVAADTPTPAAAATGKGAAKTAPTPPGATTVAASEPESSDRKRALLTALGSRVRVPRIGRTRVAGVAAGFAAVAVGLLVLTNGSGESGADDPAANDPGSAYASSGPADTSSAASEPERSTKPKRSKPRKANRNAAEDDSTRAQTSAPATDATATPTPAPSSTTPPTPAGTTPSSSPPPSSGNPTTPPPTVKPPPAPTPSPTPTPEQPAPPAGNGCTGVVGCVVDAVGNLLNPR